MSGWQGALEGWPRLPAGGALQGGEDVEQLPVLCDLRVPGEAHQRRHLRAASAATAVSKHGPGRDDIYNVSCAAQALP